MAEEGTKNTEISDSAKMDAIADIIRDACAKMDSVGSRMDAMEENFRRMDSERKDAMPSGAHCERNDSNEGLTKGEPKEVAADKAHKDCEKGADRKDSEQEKREEGYVEDGKRKDAEKGDKREDARKDEDEDKAEADSAPISRAEAARLRDQIAALTARAPAIINDADRERFAIIQEQADPAFQAFGDRAPAPLDGETPTQYKRRLGGKLQANSGKWKGARLSGISDDVMLDTIVTEIYADSIVAARAGVDVPKGALREIRTKSPAGHTIIDYVGEPDAWMGRFSGRVSRAKRRA